MRRLCGDLLRRSPGDRGSAALFVAVFAPAMIVMAGLVIDGGAGIEARQRAADIAEQAARAAAGQCDVAVLRSVGDCRLLPGDYQPARRAAAAYADGNGDGVSWDMRLSRPVANSSGYRGVRVTVTITVDTTLLAIVPRFDTLTVSETAEAIAVTGQ